MGASLYEPINVYKPLARDIGTVDGPFEYLIVAGVRLPLPFTTRMTVARLSNGDLFLHSPIKFDEGLAKALRRLGRVRHLVSPNQFHYAHIGEWVKAFPDTISWASPRVRQRARARRADIDFTRDLDVDAPEEWRLEIDQLLFPGGYFKEFIFFHKASRTLILTDTMINIELDKVSEPWRTATKLAWDVSSLRANILRDAAAAAVAAAQDEGGDRKGANMAATANFAQPWPILRFGRRRSHPKDIRNAARLRAIFGDGQPSHNQDSPRAPVVEARASSGHERPEFRPKRSTPWRRLVFDRGRSEARP